MTNRKVDVWFRFILYFFPILLLIGYFLYIRSSNTSVTIFTILSNFNVVIGQIADTTFVSQFFNWFKSNVVDTQLTNTIFLYTFYVLFVEMALLFKNVLVFIIKVANNFIERGSDIGK